MLPISGHAELRQPGRPLVAASRLIVPPQLAHSCAATSPYIALFIDSWLLPSCPQPIQLDAGQVRRVFAALGSTGSHGPDADVDLAAGYTELRARAGHPAPLDPRVAYAIHQCTLRDRDMPITSIADKVGLSAPRLRGLVRQDVGLALPLAPMGPAPHRHRLPAGFDCRPGRSHRGLRRPGPPHPYCAGLHGLHLPRCDTLWTARLRAENARPRVG
ncbi:hypothetical protein OG379_00720 [Streptomyces sp. NBC_01166]|uniref:hypothetical protein n=1 Tax=Streptomyces sp. NBC_01166 TaxID=2903755 RepID=UPI00386A41B1|nr:hypothetical protein OG379_00720 [Streptomyces sp. NBC_01166]